MSNHPVPTPLAADCQLYPSHPLPKTQSGCCDAQPCGEDMTQRKFYAVPNEKEGCCEPEKPFCEGLVLDNKPWRTTYKTYTERPLPADVPVEAWIWNRYPYPGFICETESTPKKEKAGCCAPKEKAGCCAFFQRGSCSEEAAAPVPELKQKAGCCNWGEASPDYGDYSPNFGDYTPDYGTEPVASVQYPVITPCASVQYPVAAPMASPYPGVGSVQYPALGSVQYPVAPHPQVGSMQFPAPIQTIVHPPQTIGTVTYTVPAASVAFSVPEAKEKAGCCGCVEPVVEEPIPAPLYTPVASVHTEVAPIKEKPGCCDWMCASEESTVVESPVAPLVYPYHNVNTVYYPYDGTYHNARQLSAQGQQTLLG